MVEAAAPVSVVMPARNAATTVAESLRSVLAQEGLGEVILVDDGSHDGTAAVALALRDPRVKVIQGPCRGIAAALNEGFRAARGEFVARCDADDLFQPGRLARQLAQLAARPAHVAVSAGFVSMDAKGHELAQLACDGAAREVAPDLCAGRVVTSFCSWLIRHDPLSASGGARDWFETGEDIDLQYRLACLGPVWHEPRPEYRYRLHATSITHSLRAERLAFFERMAAEFLRERLATGEDSLERGAPPEIPVFSDSPRRAGSGLKEQVLGHLTSQAWREFTEGRRREGLLRLTEALRRDPTNPARWRGLAAMALRSLRS